MKRLILHIGHSKCASSTLQSYLCEKFSMPVKDVEGNSFRYAALSDGKKPLIGKRLKAASVKKATGYVSSNLDISNEKQFLSSLNQLSSMCGKQDTVILSNEGWANSGIITLESRKALEAFGVPVDIFMLTRPPVEWFNASWWQWGAWSGQDIDSWYNAVRSINYLDSINRWNEIDNVEDIRVCDISQGPIESFLQFLGLEAMPRSHVNNVNQATNFELLKHLINNREKYGRTMHDPTIEFQFNRLLQLPKNSPPNATSAVLAKRIIRQNLNDYKALIEKMRWCNNVLSEEMIKKYTDENYYNNIESIELNAVLAAGYSDDFVGQLLDNVTLGRKEVHAGMPLLNPGDADYLTKLANKIEAGIEPDPSDAKVLKMLAKRARQNI